MVRYKWVEYGEDRSIYAEKDYIYQERVGRELFERYALNNASW